MNLQTFTNINSILTLTNAYTNATLIAAGMLTNNGDMIKLEWTIAHKRLQPATNLFQIVYGSQIIYDSGNCAASNGMSTILANVIRTGASAQVCQITSFFAMGGTTVFATTNTWHQTASQSNWLATPIGLRMASSGFMLVTNVGFRAYYEPSTQ